VADPDAPNALSWHDYTVRPSLFIVDDHKGFRDSARTLLEAEGFRVVGEATAGEEAVTAVERLRPDLVLLDIQLPGIDGFDTAELLAALARPPMVVLTSSRAASAFGSKIDSAPVRGFVTKHELSGEALARAIG
jgi:DNA-binding NarL/FixJ family response regulator